MNAGNSKLRMLILRSLQYDFTVNLVFIYTRIHKRWLVMVFCYWWDVCPLKWTLYFSKFLWYHTRYSLDVPYRAHSGHFMGITYLKVLPQLLTLIWCRFLVEIYFVVII